jgi:hypothetical protein
MLGAAGADDSLGSTRLQRAALTERSPTIK